MSPNQLSSRLSIGIDRQKLVELISSQLKILLEQGNVQSAKSILIPAQAVDIADAIELLPETMQAIAFRILAKDKAIAVYEYLEPDVQQFLLEDFKRQDVRDIIEQMSPDDRARLFDELPAKVVRRCLGGVQTGDSHYFRSNLFSIVQRRILWLIVVLATSSLGGIIIKAQEQMLEKAIVLLVFIPLVIDIGGSVGNQSSTVVIRGLNTQTFGNQGIFGVIRRETFTGIVLGLLLALGATFWSLVLQDNLAVAIVVGLSLLIISILSTLTGAILPFLFTKLNLDPALMSAPFITTFVDVIGILIYFYIAKWILGL